MKLERLFLRGKLPPYPISPRQICLVTTAPRKLHLHRAGVAWAPLPASLHKLCIDFNSGEAI